MYMYNYKNNVPSSHQVDQVHGLPQRHCVM